MSGNYGSKTDLAPPYGGTKHAEPNVQSTGGNQGSERTANLTTANASKQHPIAPKPENHAAPEADHGE